MKNLIAVLSMLAPFAAIAKVSTTTTRLRGLANTNERSGGKGTDADECLVCNVKKADVQYVQGFTGPKNDFWVCETDAADEPDGKANKVYLLEDLPQSFFDSYEKLLEQGRSRICIPKGKANRSNYKVEFSKGTTPKYLGERDDTKDDNRHRHLLNTAGTHTVLAVIVSSSKTNESDPNTNTSSVEGNMFGTGPMAQNASVASQYSDCSNGKLQMVPYTSKYVSNGIISINVNIAIAGTPTATTIQNAVVSATQTALNVSNLRYSATHVLFCLPQGSLMSGTNNWVSFGYTNGVMSFHQYSMCTRLSAPMHEIGHNNGFYHSGIGTSDYGDQSGFMSYAYKLTGHPQMCFNAQKNYISGWFAGQTASIRPERNGAWGGTLVPPVDSIDAANVLPNATVVVNVGKLYFQLNSAKKFNYETMSNPNVVNVVSADVPSNPNIKSTLVANLTVGQNYTYSNYTGTGIALVIQVCNITFGTIDTAQVSVYLNDGNQTSQCDTIV